MADRDVYTHGHAEAVLRSHRWRTVDNSAAYLAAHLTPGTSLLDVGCGPGTLTVDLARRVAPGRVVGIDVSADVVEAARAHADEVGGPDVELVVGDFRDPAAARAVTGRGDLGGERFDVVHAHQVLQHLREPVEALRAMARLVRPGGVVAVRDSDYPAMTWAPADPGLDRWRELYLAVTRRNGAAADAGRHLPAWARAAGLVDVAYTTSTWTFATPDERRWWGELWADRTVSSTLADQAVAYGLCDADELQELAAAWRRWSVEPDGVFVVLHGEVVARPGP
jgi:SAM-dependent methyltransferase